MSSPQINTLSQPARTNSLERVEAPGAALTCTRTATLALLATGTTVTWQSATRSSGFTFATGTTITIPTAGYYTLQVSYAFSANVTGFSSIIVNGTTIGNILYYSTATTRWAGAFVRYFGTGDTIALSITPNANVTLNLNAEGSLAESPILSIVQLTRPVL